MALSDYLTNDEWDACFYKFTTSKTQLSFGVSMKQTIQALITAGHEFPGLTLRGEKSAQMLGTENPEKLAAVMNNGEGFDLAASLVRGREFIRRTAPILLNESETEWGSRLLDAGREDLLLNL